MHQQYIGVESEKLISSLVLCAALKTAGVSNLSEIAFGGQIKVGCAGFSFAAYRFTTEVNQAALPFISALRSGIVWKILGGCLSSDWFWKSNLH